MQGDTAQAAPCGVLIPQGGQPENQQQSPTGEAGSVSACRQPRPRISVPPDQCPDGPDVAGASGKLRGLGTEPPPPSLSASGPGPHPPARQLVLLTAHGALAHGRGALGQLAELVQDLQAVLLCNLHDEAVHLLLRRGQCGGRAHGVLHHLESGSGQSGVSPGTPSAASAGPPVPATAPATAPRRTALPPHPRPSPSSLCSPCPALPSLWGPNPAAYCAGSVPSHT